MRNPSPSLVAVLLVAWPADAQAYRPFDGTDADVAELHEWELEIQTVGYARSKEARFFEPGGVINYGLVPRVELVLQGFASLSSDTQLGPPKFAETQLLAKVVWREGCLQDKEGPSFATEQGALLPTIHDTKGFGAYLGGILSTCFGNTLIAHWNTEIQILPQSYDLELFGGVILEPPPSKYLVRPVAELFVDHKFDPNLGVQTYSALLGAIWRVTEAFTVDVGVRGALVSRGQDGGELRAGFSLAVP